MKLLALGLLAGVALLLPDVANSAETAKKAPPASPAKKTAAPVQPRTIDARPWPRAYVVDGVKFSLYQPQVDSWSGDVLKARAVMAVEPAATEPYAGKPVTSPAYGVLWFTTRTETDKEAREVVLNTLTIDRASFPTAKDQETRYLALARKAAPTTSLVASLNQLEAALALTEAGRTPDASQPTDNDPPDIIFMFQPSVLVLIDGQPVLKPSGVAGVEHVINTRAMLLKTKDAYFIGRDGKWATAPNVNGPWTAAAKPPAAVVQAAAKLAAAAPKPLQAAGATAGTPAAANAAKKPAVATLPQIVVRTRPAELIVVEGDPQFAEIPGTSLKYIANTPGDVLIVGSGDWYVLIAGRWFTSASSMGPWRWVDPKTLPADFAKIPSDGPKGAVLVSIPGTPEAKESLVANSVPQTATVNRNEAKFQATYDGEPRFIPVDGTSLTYAINTRDPIIFAGAAGYYALKNGVWFTAASPKGPWTVATSVPPEIYKIPSASPLHFVTYVIIYGTNGDEVYVGYTPGYYGTVVSNGVVVYGSGYPCTGWTGSEWYGCPTPYGYGAAFGYGMAVGWALTFGYGWYDPWYDPWWGPWGYYPYYPYYPMGGAIAGNVYGRWGNSVVAGTAAAWANPYTGNYGAAGRGGYQNTVTGGRGYGYAGRNTNIYTGMSTAAAGGVRYNPQTGRVVAGQGGSVSNIYTGTGVAGGSRTAINTETGRVTESAGAIGRGQEGAGAAGGFRTQGPDGGQAAGAGYIHYDRDTGDISKGGVINVNGDIYAGKDGQVYKRGEDGSWEQAGSEGKFSKAERHDPSLERENLSRNRGHERDQMSGRDFDRPSASSRQSFNRSAYGGGYGGRMGGMRGGGGGRRR